jgi:[CysO sulfur-carrier protein]-S-L-cysteine hydrolase
LFSGGRSHLDNYPSELVVSIKLTRNQLNTLVAHARAAAPQECCGLIGGSTEERAQTIYPARNVSADPLVTYEAAAEDLFAAQRAMRERGEQLLAIYHSHPRATNPEPSPTDVRLAYYPSAVYLIAGLGNDEPCVRAFRIDERTGSWEPIDYEII